MPKCYKATYQQFKGDYARGNCPELIRKSFSFERRSWLFYDAVVG
jgi:hypothetical protein